MNPLAAAARDLLALGLSGDQLVAALNRMEQVLYVDAPRAVDEAADRRRARDRDRKRQAKVTQNEVEFCGIPQTSADSTDSTETLSPPSSPQTPQLPPHTRGYITTQAREAASFDEFWAAYPRKVGKDAAAKAYAQAIRRAGGHDPPAEILAGLFRAKPGWTDPQFTPHPATWLNQGRWQDEAPPIQSEPVRPTHVKSSHQQARLDERHENYRNAVAGFESFVERRAEQSSGGF